MLEVQTMRSDLIFYELEDVDQLIETLNKKTRPYFSVYSLGFKIDNLIVYVPLRSSKKHEYVIPTLHGYLDFMKIIVTETEETFNPQERIIDNKEYNYIDKQRSQIISFAKKTIEDYKMAYEMVENNQNFGGLTRRDKRRLERLYTYSTLKNFHSELGLK